MNDNKSDTEEHIHINKWGVLVATLLGSFTVILNNSLFNVALPQFMTIFELNAPQAQWSITAFKIAMLVTMPLTGYLGVVWGRRRLYLLGMSLFLCGSVLGWLSQDFHMIVVYRILQGLGGGVILPLSMVLIFAHFPPKERGLATGIWGIAAMMAPAIGPTLGGFVLDYSTWQNLFLMNIPTGVICIFAVLYFLKLEGERKTVHFDTYGYVAIVIGIITLIIGVNRLQYGFSEGSLMTLGLISMGAICLIAFVWIELHTKVPLLDLRVFKNLIFSFSLIIIATSTVNMFSGMLLIPLLLQEVRDYSALTTGLVMLPQALVVGLSMAIGGRILDHHGISFILPVGLFILGGTTFILGIWSGGMALWVLMIFLALRGFGIGWLNTPATTAGLNVLREDQIGSAVSLNNMTRQLASTMAVIFIALFFEARRGYYVTLDVPLQEAGVLAIQQSFIVLAFLVVLCIPLSIMITRYNKQMEDKR